FGRHLLPKTLSKVLARFQNDRSALVPALQAAQSRLGYLPKEAIREVARHCRVPESTVFGVATFYEQFHLTRQGKHKLKVCRGTACHVRGSRKIMSALRKKLGIKPGETTPDYEFTLERVACFGACALAPVVVINDEVHGKMNAQKTLKAIKKLK
ncbi:MAG: NADH-quinone oxidoreductase subunit NuoE, partial [Planctomycetota bacterium]